MLKIHILTFRRAPHYGCTCLKGISIGPPKHRKTADPGWFRSNLYLPMELRAFDLYLKDIWVENSISFKMVSRPLSLEVTNSDIERGKISLT